MVRLAVAVFLITHGLIHAGIYATPKARSKPTPFDPSYSSVLAVGHIGATTMRSVSIALGLAVAAVYATAGWAVAIDTSSWTRIAVLAAGLGLALKGVWFHRWLVLGIALDVGVLAAVATGWPPSL